MSSRLSCENVLDGADSSGSIAISYRDEKTEKAVNLLYWVRIFGFYSVTSLLVLYTVLTFVGGSLSEGIVVLIFSFLLWVAWVWVLKNLILKPLALVRYGARLKEIETQMIPQLGLTPSMQWSWKLPSPGIIVMDQQKRVVFVESADTQFYQLVLKPNQIIGAKVERETELHTKTTHSGSFSIFSMAGFGYTFGSRSKSKTKAIDRAFLELHYVYDDQSAPSLVVIPFGTQRRSADSMVVALTQIKQ